ncbi:hypothetical protein ACFLZV_01550 [Candidatus Margulisiibacteriota bacterium]
MKKMFFILLQNNYLLPFTKKPKKAGNYLANVRLFETDETTTCLEVCEWVNKKYKSESIKEVTDWT